MSKSPLLKVQTSEPVISTQTHKTFNFDGKRVSQTLFKFLKILGRIFAGTIVLFALAEIAPALRQEIPSFYRLVDSILGILEWGYQKFWIVFG